MDEASNQNRGGSRRPPRGPSLRKRRRGIQKKAGELSAMCGAEVALICYGPDGGEPTLWPEDPFAVDQTLGRFFSLSKEEQDRRRVELSTSSAARNEEAMKAAPAAHVRVRGGRDGRMGQWHSDLDACSDELLRGLRSHLAEKKQLVKARIDELKSSSSNVSALKRATPPTITTTPESAAVGGGGGCHLNYVEVPPITATTEATT